MPPAGDGPGVGGSGGEGGHQDTDAELEPQQRGRGWLLLAVSVAVAAVLIAVLAMVNRQDDPQAAAPPSPKPSPRPTPTISIQLDPPADHDTYVDLKWAGDKDLNYALVIAQPGKPADVKLVYKRTKYRVPVVPGVQYCFIIQATDGIQRAETKPLPIRNARCEK